MVVISVIGTSGSGTTFLVKQLASYYNSPAFFEGEEGTIPKDVFENVFSGEDPRKRCEWYVNLYDKNYRKAFQISKLGVDCFVDGGPITAHANILFDDEKYLSDLKKMVSRLDIYKSDKIILIKINESKLNENILKRARDDEPIRETIDRSLKLQEKLLELAKKEENVVIVDRSNLDFTKIDDLKVILEKIGI